MRQHTGGRNAVLAALLICFVLTGAASRAATAAPQDSRWGAGYFPNVPLITQDGKTVRFYDDLLKGKTVAVNVMYTSCRDECPLETARLVQVQKMLGDLVGNDIFFYSISIDPKHDTPAVLKEYAEKFHVGPGWLFLTGKTEDITLVSKKLGLSSATDTRNRDGHQPSLMIGKEATGQWMRQSAEDNPRFLASVIGNFVGKGGQLRNYAEARALPALDEGHHIFQMQCAACHTIGEGDRVGPDLLGVTRVRDRAWLARFIATPDRVLAEKDPIAMALFAKYRNVAMPNLRLGRDDVEALLKYMETETVARQGQAATQSMSASAVENGSGHEHHHHHHHHGTDKMD